MILSGDIGGTNARLAVFEISDNLKKPIFEKSYLAKNFKSLDQTIEAFLNELDLEIKIKAIGLAAAGPIDGGAVRITNANWEIDRKDLKKKFGNVPILLVNDLVGLCNYVPYIKKDHLHELNPGVNKKNKTIAVIAPGTGLGEGFLVWDNKKYIACPSEGGHVDFAPTNELQNDLLKYLKNKSDHVSFENICSGVGIPKIFEFMVESNIIDDPNLQINSILNSQDPVPEIFDAALDKENPSLLCNAVLDLFVDVLGAEAGNLSLKVMASSGIFIGGGIPPRILGHLEKRFMKAFLNKGVLLNKLLKDIPVNIILHKNPALYGVATAVLEKLANL